MNCRYLSLLQKKYSNLQIDYWQKTMETGREGGGEWHLWNSLKLFFELFDFIHFLLEIFFFSRDPLELLFLAVRRDIGRDAGGDVNQANSSRDPWGRSEPVIALFNCPDYCDYCDYLDCNDYQTRIYYFCDKCIVFARNRKFVSFTQ